jgi:hypothetical protein
MFGLSIGVAIVQALAMALLPSSPRWLFLVGRDHEVSGWEECMTSRGGGAGDRIEQSFNRSISQSHTYSSLSLSYLPRSLSFSPFLPFSPSLAFLSLSLSLSL